MTTSTLFNTLGEAIKHQTIFFEVSLPSNGLMSLPSDGHFLPCIRINSSHLELKACQDGKTNYIKMNISSNMSSTVMICYYRFAPSF